VNPPPAAALRSRAVAEALFLASIVVVPLLAGTAIAYAGRPWWWAAVVAVVVLLVFAIAPAPEEGEPRVAAGDVLFLVGVSAIAVGLVWLGALLGRRLRARRVSARA
jgi:apolipoprotein N-acyltransferase